MNKTDNPITASPEQAWPQADVSQAKVSQAKVPQTEVPKKDLPHTEVPAKGPLAQSLALSKRGRRRHRRQVFKPKRRGRPRHMLPGGSR